MNARDVRSMFDAIDAAFGRSPRRMCDYSLAPGDRVSVGDITYVVRGEDFFDPTQATALELAVCLGAMGADVDVVQDGDFKRVEPRPRIRRA